MGRSIKCRTIREAAHNGTEGNLPFPFQLSWIICHPCPGSLFAGVPIATNEATFVTCRHKLALLLLFTAPLRMAAQTSFYDRLSGHNAEMAKLQPALISPLVAPDPRLLQYYRFSVAHQYTAAGTETTNYGNARGGGIIAYDRFEFDWAPSPYIQHNDAAIDGFGDTSVSAKVRIASGDSEHGNFDLAASLAHCFATGSHSNGGRTDSFTPTLAGDVTYRHVSFVSGASGTLPTGKIAAQGRTIAWNEVVQFHAKPHVWLEAENNATFLLAGSHDGKMQNFITPGAFYVLRPRHWAPTHAFFIFDSGMQIATSGFHTYNHNWVSEVRVLF